MHWNCIHEFNPFKSAFLLTSDFKTLVFNDQSLTRIILGPEGMTKLRCIYVVLNKSYNALWKLSHLILRDSKSLENTVGSGGLI